MCGMKWSPTGNQQYQSSMAVILGDHLSLQNAKVLYNYTGKRTFLIFRYIIKNMDQNQETHQSVAQSPSPQQISPEDRRRLVVAILVAVVILALIVVAAYFLLTAETSTTSKIRDVFIIFMALESLVIGAALFILMIQLAILINLLQNEIKPILHSTNDTVNTLRGTVTFLSNNLVEPVIKLNEYLAGFKRFIDLLKPGKR